MADRRNRSVNNQHPHQHDAVSSHLPADDPAFRVEVVSPVERTGITQ